MPGYNTGYKNHELTAAIELAPYVPGRIGGLGLFQEAGVPRTHVDLEYKAGVISIIQTKERGGRDSSFITGPKRKLYPFKIPHIPQESVIRPDDLPDVRAFGTIDGKIQVQEVVKERLMMIRQNFEATWEYHRMGAVNGIIKDADGSEIHNLYTIFGITEKVISIQLDGTDKNAVKSAAADMVAYVQDTLGASSYGYLRVMCGDVFFKTLILLDEVKDAYDRYKDGEFLRNNQMRQSFEYAGIIWENYRGKIGTVEFIASNQARVIPVGVPGLFIRRNGPDDTMTGVGKLGKKITITEERLPHDAGIELRAQSNPLFLCTRPSVLIKLTIAAPTVSS